jgi:hypothetical protein
MPEIAISDPTSTGIVAQNFTARGTLSLDRLLAALGDRRGEVKIECFIDTGASKFPSNPPSHNDTSWQADFVGAPVGSDYTLHAILTVTEKEFKADPVKGVRVISSDVGRLLLESVAEEEKREFRATAAEAVGAAANLKTPGPDGKLKAIPVHHEVSKAVSDQTLLKLRSISAAYFVDGVQLTRVFDARINPLDGDYHLKMDLRRAAGAKKPGSIIFRVELWPTLVFQLSESNLIIVDT